MGGRYEKDRLYGKADWAELAGQVLGKLEAMSDAEFAEVALEAAE